jgi:hypothetical protein
MTDGTLETVDGSPRPTLRPHARPFGRARLAGDHRSRGARALVPAAADWTPATGENGQLSEEQAHQPWDEVHERYAERFGIDPTPGRRFMAAQRAGQR